MAMAVPPHISALWFPTEQRTTATGLSSIANRLGGSGAFLIGPLIVRQPDGVNTDATRDDVMTLMYVEAGFLAALFLAALAAAAPTASFWSGLRQAAKAPDLPWVVAVYSLSLGVPAAYFGVLDINVGQIGVTQDEAGWLGFWAGISSSLSALVVACLTDIFRGHMKATIIGLLTCAAACFVWQLALIAEWLPFSLSMLYCSTLLSISFAYSTSPLLLEYAAELSYPVSTDVIGAIISFCFNLVSALYLVLFLIKPLSENTCAQE
ncbi:solute carrier family 49 member 4 homolog [Pollicipes pollicipes]|uniref:solute carrier family 49 member 4 homolog n=1 Tax=Pollicipes pollicipes TaxID=41117 RepID=UPI0018855112|nr:solute carrier family 49 member 4 homolog [Pollicipes pollicipes]